MKAKTGQTTFGDHGGCTRVHIIGQELVEKSNDLYDQFREQREAFQREHFNSIRGRKVSFEVFEKTDQEKEFLKVEKKNHKEQQKNLNRK